MLGTLALVPVAVLIAVAPPAHACSCAPGEVSDQVGSADGVFTGSLVETPAEPGDGRAGEAPDAGEPAAVRVRFTVDVDRVFKGDVPGQVEVITARSSASCGIDPLPGEDDTWLWFVTTNEKGDYAAYLCGGSGPAADKRVAQVVDVTGEGVEASEAADDRADGGSPLGEGEGDADDEARSAVPWGVGGVLLVLAAAVIGAMVVRRRS